MDRVGKEALKSKHADIYQSIEPKDLMDYVIQEDALTEDERDIVLAEVTRRGRVDKFLGFLKRKQNGFDIFLRILEHGGLDWIKEPLETERKRLIADGEDYALLERCDQAKIRQKLTQKQCLELGKCLGRHWKEVAIKLDMEQEIYTIESDTTCSPNMRGFEVLNKWCQRQTNNANLCAFLPILDDIGVEYDEGNIIKQFT